MRILHELDSNWRSELPVEGHRRFTPQSLRVGSAVLAQQVFVGTSGDQAYVRSAPALGFGEVFNAVVAELPPQSNTALLSPSSGELVEVPLTPFPVDSARGSVTSYISLLHPKPIQPGASYGTVFV